MEDIINKEVKDVLEDGATPNASGHERQELWNQLDNAVSMETKEDQIVWTIFGIFWVANAVLSAALFTTGTILRPSVSIIVSIVGIILSWIWFLIPHKAIGWLSYYERIIQGIEEH